MKLPLSTPLVQARLSLAQLWPKGTRPKELLRGERLFSMQSSATSFLGLSCDTCHPGGGSDGLSWRLKGRTSTPTLPAKGTARDDTWLQRHAVSLHGQGFSDADAKALVRYLREGIRTAQ